MTLQRTILLVCLVLSTLSISAQKEANIWHFGANAGMDFNPGAPVPLLGGMTNTLEGVASIADANGVLQFYTDGTRVWDRTHTVMPNGTGLMGGGSSTQSGIIVPKPGAPNMYYLFTVAVMLNANGMRYSEVDMTLNGGNGDIVVATKNTPLTTPTTEKICAVMHRNNVDIWVVTHDWNNNDWLAYLVTAAGVNPVPVRSSAGVVHNGGAANTIGQLKFSPDGSKMAYGTYTMNTIELLDFDISTGMVSNALTLTNYRNEYGVEFSPDGSKVYFSSWTTPNGLYQYDISSGVPATILASRTQLDGQNVSLGSLQLAPDGKIYVARVTRDTLGVINDPNLAGTACNYDKYGFYLGGPQSRGGLPNFISSYFNTPVFDVIEPCLGDTTQFVLSDTANIDSVRWSFGDPASGPLNTSTDWHPYHYYANIGLYQVSVIIHVGSLSDTVTKVISVTLQPSASLRSDTILCEGNVLTLDPGTNAGADFNWSTGETTQTIQVDTSGTYIVDVNYGNLCFAGDTVNITFTPAPIVDLGPDTTLCGGGWMLLDAGNPGSAYTWSTGDTTQWITVLSAGTYSVDVSYLGCPDADTIEILMDQFPVIDLGPDTSFCVGENYDLDAGTASTYLWSTGDTSQILNVTTSGTYIVTTANGACEIHDTVNVTFDPTPIVNLGPDQTVCGGTSITLDAGNPGASYVWSTGELTQTISVNYAGTFIAIVDQNGCIGSDTMELTLFTPPTVSLGDDETICDYDQAILVASDGLASYEWSTGQTGQTIFANAQNTYYVFGVDANGCSSDTAYQNIFVEDCSCEPDKNLFIPNVFTPTQTTNSTFYIQGNTNMFIQEIRIFNRWGEMVFTDQVIEVGDASRGWDGTYKGVALPPQAFAYFIIAQCGGETYTVSGNVTLLR